MPTSSSHHARDLVLIGLHIALGVFLLMLSLLAHGRVPGLSADESAALGFLVFFGLGLPVLLVAIGTCMASVFVGGRWLGVLAIAMIVTTVFAVFNVWTGVVSSVVYLAFAIWVVVQRIRRPGEPGPPIPSESD